MNHFKTVLDTLTAEIGSIILGKETQIRLIIAALLARGHVLIEDLPGVGKTTLAHTLAQALGLSFQRVQFTSDLLPADIIGVSVYDRHEGEFKFHPGPIFTQMVLADEINRATPKTQSALLEAMEEHQVTVEGETRQLPTPFFVIATQNPMHQIGTFPLPESQLDRFMMRVELGYPSAAAERVLLRGQDRRNLIAELAPCLSVAELQNLQHQVFQVKVSDALLDYLQALLQYTRDNPMYLNGVSPRAGLGILRCAQAWAMTAGRDFVVPEDVQAVLPSVVGHRLNSAVEGRGVQGLVTQLIEQVPIP